MDCKTDNNSKILGEAIAEIKSLRAELEKAKAKTLKCFHCCDMFPVMEALQIGDKVFCSKKCMKPYTKVVHYK